MKGRREYIAIYEERKREKEKGRKRERREII